MTFKKVKLANGKHEYVNEDGNIIIRPIPYKSIWMNTKPRMEFLLIKNGKSVGAFTTLKIAKETAAF